MSGLVWREAKEIKSELLSDGWASPNTYDAYFKPLRNSPAVYLFLLHERETFQRAVVAYVGMSGRLAQRIAGHNILPMLDVEGYWPMIWFKPVKKRDLRETEGVYIRKFAPPWNIAGRVRGVQLQ